MSVTTKTLAWTSGQSSLSHADLQNPDRIHQLTFYKGDLAKHGLTCVGEASITFEPIDERILMENKVTALREQAKNIRAAATAEVTRIEGQIQQLLCIENSTIAEKTS